MTPSRHPRWAGLSGIWVYLFLIVGAALAFLLAVLPRACSAAPTRQSANGVLWSSGFETGDLSEWTRKGGGAVDNSGTGAVNVNNGNGIGVASTDVAHTGNYSLKMTISGVTNTTTGVRFFRWHSQTGYYSAWYYFPQVYSGMNWWNVFQWKDANNNPAWSVNVENVGGQMRYWLYDAYTGGVYNQSVANIPVGHWVHLEAYYKIASDNTGRVTVYQNGQQLIDAQNVQTEAPGTGIYWGVSNYTDNIVPSTATIYVDDAAISTNRLGPGDAGASAQPQSARPAQSQEAPRFVLGFKVLAELLGRIAGQPLENEHSNSINGDTVQRATTGLMAWRKADNVAAFTDGSRTWLNGPYGLQERANDQRFPWENQS